MFNANVDEFVKSAKIQFVRHVAGGALSRLRWLDGLMAGDTV